MQMSLERVLLLGALFLAPTSALAQTPAPQQWGSGSDPAASPWNVKSNPGAQPWHGSTPNGEGSQPFARPIPDDNATAHVRTTFSTKKSKLPIFDIWPFPYATSFELKPGCQPLPQDDPRFYECFEDVGKFPEVALQPKTLYTRILRWFGAGLVPIL